MIQDLFPLIEKKYRVQKLNLVMMMKYPTPKDKR